MDPLHSLLLYLHQVAQQVVLLDLCSLDYFVVLLLSIESSSLDDLALTRGPDQWIAAANRTPLCWRVSKATSTMVSSVLFIFAALPRSMLGLRANW